MYQAGDKSKGICPHCNEIVITDIKPHEGKLKAFCEECDTIVGIVYEEPIVLTVDELAKLLSSKTDFSIMDIKKLDIREINFLVNKHLKRTIKLILD